MRMMMSRAVISGSVALALFVCLSTSARSAELRFGATAGLNWTGLKGDTPNDASYGRAVGFGAGLVGDLALTDDVFLSFQPMYAGRGTNIAYKVGEEEPRDSLEVRLDYIDCLLLVKVFSDSERFYVSSGLGLGFLTGGTVADIHDGEVDAKSLFKGQDLSVIFGVGYVVPANNSLLTVELRYQQSLLNVGDEDALASGSGVAPRIRFHGFQVLATVLFPRNHN